MMVFFYLLCEGGGSKTPPKRLQNAASKPSLISFCMTADIAIFV